MDSTLSPVVWLTCCCCGDGARGRQWHNRDDGYGLCATCVPYCKRNETPESFEACYGVEGVHYNVNEGPKFRVGDRVTFVNDQGVAFPGRTITEVIANPRSGVAYGYHVAPTDTPWFPHAERNLYWEYVAQ